MPKVIPSDVLAFLSKSGLPRDGTPNQSQAGLVSALVELLSAVPEGHFLALQSEDYSRLIVVRGLLRAACATSINGGPLALGGRYSFLGGTGAVVSALFELLGKCPDTAPAEHVSGLEFLNDPDLAAVLRQDMTTAETALANGEFKASCVMAGSVVEALLLWALRRKGDAAIEAAIRQWPQKGGAKPDKAKLLKWDLSALIGVACLIDSGLPPLRPGKPRMLLSDPCANVADSLRNFRNLIHPGKEEREKANVSRGAAQAAVAAMTLVAEELEGCFPLASC